MTRIVSPDDMTNVRNSLAQAGIHFDKLYINQAYFNSNFTIQTKEEKSKTSKNNHFWHKLLCGSKTKQASTGTQTVLTVRDDSEIKRPPPPPIIRRQPKPPTENLYDRRRYRPINREYTLNNYQNSIRRRRSSLITRSVQVPRPKTINNHDDDENDEFSV